jgi:hypothetical protein
MTKGRPADIGGATQRDSGVVPLKRQEPSR